MAAAMRGLAGLLVLLFLTSVSIAAERAIIVLDASGSMWGQIDGKPKLEIARETLKTVLADISGDLELGLMAYGHRQKGVCTDIELVVPPAAGTGPAIASAAAGMRFLGMTPLSAAVQQAAEALRYTEQKATVILITDGIETCNADPCALGTSLEEAGIDFTAHVVGFGLSAEEGRQVACLAENTGGKYFQAGDAGQLADALVQTVAAEPEPAPAPEPKPEPAPDFNIIPTTALSEGGPDLTDDGENTYVVYKAGADGARGEYVSTDYGAWKGNLEPGDYVLSSKVGYAEIDQPVTIEAGKVAKPHFILNAGTMIIHPYASEGAEISDSAAVFVDYPGDGETTSYGDTKMVVPAGEQAVRVSVGAGQVSQTIPVEAGETVERNIVVGVGHVVANAYYVDGMKVDDGGVSFEILKAARKIDGSRDDVVFGYGPDNAQDLPAGDYVVVARMDQAIVEQPFSVKSGERNDLAVTLNAGVLAISAAGATNIEVFSSAKDIQGNRKAFGYAYAETHQTTLPAGDYTVVAKMADGGAKEGVVTVKAGERGELNLP